jgi:hypothetical protein
MPTANPMHLEAPLDEERCVRKVPWVFEKPSSHHMIDWVLTGMGGSVTYKKGILRGSASTKINEPAMKKARKSGASKTADNSPEVLDVKTKLPGYKARGHALFAYHLLQFTTYLELIGIVGIVFMSCVGCFGVSDDMI